MALADFFRPKHKHSKSDVRAAAVAAMDKDDLDILVEVASGDKEASIRKAAIAKIADPDTLVEVAEKQDDKKLRDYASKLALDLWTSRAISSEDEKEAKIAFNHAAAHGGQRAVAHIAGSAQLDEVRSQALARLEDDKALGQMVRKSQRRKEWQAALERIEEIQVVRSIAIDETRKEVALAALERIEDSEILEEVAAKAKNKSIRAKAKRARAALAKSETPTSNVSDQDKRERAERVQLARRLEKLAGGDEWIDSREEVDKAEARWAELGEGSDSKLATRFAKALARYRKNLEVYGAAAEAKRAAETDRVQQAEEAETASGEAHAEESTDAAPGEQPHTEPAAAAKSVEEAREEAEKAKKTEQAKAAQEADERDRRLDNQDELERLCERLGELRESDRIKGFDKTLKEIDKARRKIGPLPKESAESLEQRFDEGRKQAVIHLGDLREAEDWKRWAAVPKMEALIVRAKALLADTENTRLGESLKVLQKEWKELGAGPKDKGEELWQSFKGTCDEVYERVKEERDARNQEQKVNLAKKEALCERAEELATSTDWDATSLLFKDMQAEWKTIGPVPRRKSDNLWKRFRSACDAFFEARAPHLEDRISEEQENLDAKEALIVEIEQLAANDQGELEEQIEKVRTMQRQWREIGRVHRSKFESLNKRYTAACDRVYGKREAQAEAEKAARESLVQELSADMDACADAGWDSDASEIADKVLDVRRRYLELDSQAPNYEELGHKLIGLIRTQLESEPDAYKGTELDPDRSAEKREELITRAEEYIPAAEETGEKTAQEIADELRAALADRALGGVLSKGGMLSARDRVEDWRNQWEAIGPVPGQRGRRLTERFESVCLQVLGVQADDSTETEEPIQTPAPVAVAPDAAPSE